MGKKGQKKSVPEQGKLTSDDGVPQYEVMLDFRILAQEALETHPDKPVIVIGPTEVSYGKFEEMIQEHANALSLQGVRKGDRIGLLSCNHPDLAALFFAIWRIGGVAVPLNHLYRASEVEYATEHCGTKILIVQDELAKGIAEDFTKPACLEKVFTFDCPVDGVGGPWRKELSGGHLLVANDAPSGDDPAAIYYTSGSTAKPKGVTHTASSILDTAHSRATTAEAKHDDVWILSTQLVHVSASLGSLMPAISVGGTVVFLEEFSPQLWLRAFDQHRPTRSVILPALLHDILECEEAKQVDFSKMRSLECAGDFVTPDLYDAWEALSSLPITQMIGMTECEGYCGRHPGDPVKRGSAGKPRLNVEVRVVDAEGKDLPSNQIGELCLRSKSMMVGYWNDPKNTEATIKNGWLYSGDEGRIDEDGDIWFVGRFKEIIIKKGSNIAPGEVESVLDQHPDIAESAVVGTPPGPKGQRIVAYVELEPGHSLDEKAVADWTGQYISDFKVPDAWVVVGSMPRNAVGKLDRAALHRETATKFPPR